MTTTLSQLQIKEISLLPNNSAQRSGDHTFEEKLRIEQERLGILFSPWSQLLSTISTSDINLFSDFPNTQANFEPHLQSEEEASSSYQQTYQSQNLSQSTNQPTSQSSNHPILQFSNYLTQQIQELLMKTNWLVPNLEAQPFFYQASVDGKLLNKLDLQFLVDQILEQVKLVKEKGKVELILGLRPEELGEILLTLTSRSGMISIEIRAAEETKKLLEAELEELKAALKKARIELEEIILREVKSYA